jgi:flagellar basal-body rod protein FlgB
MPIGLDAYLGDHAGALALRAYRGEVLASNIANADTPNYQARDFDFAAALRRAMSGVQAVRLAQTSERHLSGAGQRQPVIADLQYRVPVQPSIDGNTVELDTELAQFSENAMRYQATLTFLNERIHSLRTALTGQ